MAEAQASREALEQAALAEQTFLQHQKNFDYHQTTIEMKRQAIRRIPLSHRLVGSVMKAAEEAMQASLRDENLAWQTLIPRAPVIATYTFAAFKAKGLSGLAVTDPFVILSDPQQRFISGSYRELYQSLKNAYNDKRREANIFQKGAEFGDNLAKFYKSRDKKTDFHQLNDAQKLWIAIAYAEQYPKKRTAEAFQSLWKPQLSSTKGVGYKAS